MKKIQKKFKNSSGDGETGALGVVANAFGKNKTVTFC